MPNARYQTGARLERLWMAQMKRRGYVTMRSAGSKGAIDCAAFNDGELILAQIKNGKAAYTSKDIAKLRKLPRPAGVRVVLYERVGAGGVEWKEIEC